MDHKNRARSIGAVLQIARVKQRLSCQAVAARCGMTKQGVWNMERSDNPLFDSVRKVCKVLNLSLDDVSKQLPKVVTYDAPSRDRGRPTKDQTASAA